MNEPIRYCAFDIEITKVLPEGARDWSAFRPLGISCAATVTGDGGVTTWYGKGPEKINPKMNIVEVRELVKYLQDRAAEGYRILTWNGLGFDFDILAEESGMVSDCKELAMTHIDMMFHIFCLKGYAIGLDKAAKGMGLKGKPPGMTGEMAPRLWAAGQYQEVLDYVQQDTKTLLELVHVTEIESQVRWHSNSGRPQYLSLPSGWLPVKEAMKLPEPDTSWMSNPWPRTKFTRWMEI